MKTLTSNTRNFLRSQKIASVKFILAFDAGNTTRYINDEDDKNGTAFESSAKQFDTKQEAIEYNEAKGYLCFPIEIEIDKNGEIVF